MGHQCIKDYNKEVKLMQNSQTQKYLVFKQKQSVNQLYQEIDILKQIQDHDFVNKLVDIRYYNDKYYIVQSYFEGKPLKECLRKTSDDPLRKTSDDPLRKTSDDPLSFDKKLDIVIQIAQILEILHQKNILFRNLTIENILYDGKQVKLVGFSQAKDLKIPCNRSIDDVSNTIFNYQLSYICDITAFGFIMFNIFQDNHYTKDIMKQCLEQEDIQLKSIIQQLISLKIDQKKSVLIGLIKEEERQDGQEEKQDELDVKQEEKKDELDEKQDEKKDELDEKQDEKKDELDVKQEEKQDELDVKQEEKQDELDVKQEEKQDELDEKQDERDIKQEEQEEKQIPQDVLNQMKYPQRPSYLRQITSMLFESSLPIDDKLTRIKSLNEEEFNLLIRSQQEI